MWIFYLIVLLGLYIIGIRVSRGFFFFIIQDLERRLVRTKYLIFICKEF